MKLEHLLQRLEAEQAKLAHEALQHPQPGEFNYGRAVGLYAGIEMAKRILIDTVAEKERKDFAL